MSALHVFQALALKDLKNFMMMVRSHHRRHPFPFQLFALLILNLAIAPAVVAATGP